jgi:hypothetical protein
MRLIYLDEAGISTEPGLCVAGVLIHGDHEAPFVEQKLQAVVNRYIPEQDRLGFAFHAVDIFQGTRYFGDRNKWSRDTRNQILNDIAGIIDELSLPVVASFYQKDTFGEGVPEVLNAAPDKKREIMQSICVLDCAIWADRWLEKYATSENAIIIAEDTDRVKRLVKASIMLFRTPAMLQAYGIDWIQGLPLKRIIDTVHFASKGHAAALQLADLCAFTLCRMMRHKPVPFGVLEILHKHYRWIQSFKPNIKLPDLSEFTETIA